MPDSKATRKTKEELAQEAEALAKEAEENETGEPEPSEPEALPQDTEEVQAAPESEETPDTTPEEEPTPEKEEVEAVPETQEQAEPSKELYKRKFSASSREAQKIHARNRRLDQGIEEASEIPEPTEEELQAEYPDWDLASVNERIALKEALHSKRWREKITEARQEAKKIEKWADDVNTFADDPKTLIDYPELEGKTEEFRQFANADTNNSVPFNVLIGAFLYSKSKEKTEHKGKMFPEGSGGLNEKPKTKGNKISVEESENLRLTNYPLYKEKLRAGLIQNEI